MRAGERGSISPAGDLIAFGVALSIVVGLSGILPLMFPEHGSDEGVDPGAVSAFMAWSGWDRDGDGILEERSLEEISAGTQVISLDGEYLVSISYGTNEDAFLFMDGKVENDLPVPDPGMAHSVSILVKTDGGILPGTMSISEASD